MPKFLRHTSHKYSKLGLRRKKKQIWRRPTGRDNKMREQRRGKPPIVSIGYSKNKKDKGKVNNKIPKIVQNIKDLNNIQKDQIIVLGKVGKKKKIEIAKKAKELKIEVYNFNPERFLKRNSKKGEIKDKNNKEDKK